MIVMQMLWLTLQMYLIGWLNSIKVEEKFKKLKIYKIKYKD